MLRRHDKRDESAQVFLEYAVVVGIIAVIIFSMSTVIKRGTQGMIKVVADQIGNQANSDQQFNQGFLESSYSSIGTASTRQKIEFNGVTTYIINTTTTIDSDVLIDMGFTPDN